MGTSGSRVASSLANCVTKPGCGMRPGGVEAQLCPASTYSMGGDQAACLPCPANLSTAREGASSIDQCAAPPGYFFQVRHLASPLSPAM